MRRFSSYGPVDTRYHYYAPRKGLIEDAYIRLTGENAMDVGHYITVWAPRQCGKTWLMQQILFRLKKEPKYHAIKINLEHLKYETDTAVIIGTIAKEIGEGINKYLTGIDTQTQFQEIFRKSVLEKPLILFMDEFDALSEEAINAIVSAFRNIHITHMDEIDKTTSEKSYLLHGVALIGVRSVLGIENAKGSPFNIQRSVHIPNLTFEEVVDMFHWYERESDQPVEPAVIKKLYDETSGQPGLISWFGELLTEGFDDYRIDGNRPINLRDFEIVYAAAIYALPNNNILNLISKAKEESNKPMVLKMFQTDQKMEFKYDNPIINALYMNGIAEKVIADRTRYYVKFSSPFVQKRLFNYFSDAYFNEMGTLVEPYVHLDDVITDAELFIPGLLNLYQAYLDKNKEWLFKSAPRRTDMRIYEAIFHFNLYSYINSFLDTSGGRVFPEFPTGNGKIDLIITYKNNRYGLELKSFTNLRDYKTALAQAAKYGKQLKLKEIFLIFFVQYIDGDKKKKYEKEYLDASSSVTVLPIFVTTGE